MLAEFGKASDTHELNVLAAQIARKAADEFSTTAKPRFVAGSMGPTTKSITLRGDVTMHELSDSYYAQAAGLLEGGVDILLVETAFDTRNIKAALLAIQKLERERGIQDSDHAFRHRRALGRDARRPACRCVLRLRRKS